MDKWTLHSTVVLLKDHREDFQIEILQALHSTVVLLKEKLKRYETLSNYTLHSTVVLLKVKIDLQTFYNYDSLYILL